MQRPPTKRSLTYVLILTLIGSLFSIVLPAAPTSYASHENITVNIGIDDVTDVYEPGDSVAIEVVIDDVVENEDVVVRVGEPGDSTPNEVETDEPSDNGIFDYVYDVPNGADEGVWTVQIEYDDEEAFTYFIVDDNSDPITVTLDNGEGIYEAGDDVTVAGQVDEVDLDEADTVNIIVLDPANNEIEDEDVELGDGSLPEDEFEFEFPLDDSAPHGRYAVIVTYDVDDQEGSILFEIEDDDSGGSNDDDEIETITSDSDGDLSAEIDDDSYEQGETVTVSGAIDGYDPDDTEELGISIRDPDDEEIEEDDDVTVEEDGSDGAFEFEYDLEDDADEGAYTVTVTYNNDEVELVFEVVEGSSDGGNNGGGSGSSDITVNLNKGSYLAGETITVTGTVADVADPEDGEMVSVFIYRPTGQVILQGGSSKYVTPLSSGAYSATILVPSNLDEDEDYKVVASYLGEQAEAQFDITGVSSNPSDELTVDTDREEYEIGSTVRISGNVPSSMVTTGQTALLLVNKPDGGPCRTDQISIPSTGSFSYSMPLGGNCGVAGEYEVLVTYTTAGGANLEGETTFQLTGSSAAKYNLNVEGDTYPIEYELSDGSINSMFVRPTEDKLVINLNAEDDGQLTLVLPREVIDAVEDGDDIDYVVTIEDGSGNVIIADIEETENTDEARTLVIDYPAGAERVEISGTQVVPEFGAVAGIIMAVAIVGIILASTKYGRQSLFRR